MISKNVLGIDISDNTIKIVQLDGGKSVVAYRNFDLPKGIVKKGIIVDQMRFVEVCKTILSKRAENNSPANIFSTTKAIVSIPSERVWSHTLVIPEDIEDDKQEEFLLEQAAKVVPVDFEKIYTASSISSVRGTWFATFVGAEKEIVDSYRSCLSEAGFEVEFIGSHFYSIARAILPKSFGDDNYLVIDIDGQRTTIGAFDETAIAYVSTQSLVSGEDIYKSLQSQTVTDEASGEEKQDAALSKIVAEVEKVKMYFTKCTKQEITKVVVVGQFKDMSNLITYFTDALSINVSLGDSHKHINNAAIFDEPVDVISFANAIGLALYGIDRTLPHINLLPDKNPKHRSWHLTPPTRSMFAWKKIFHKSSSQQKVYFKILSSRDMHVITFVVLALSLGILAYVISHYLLRL